MEPKSAKPTGTIASSVVPSILDLEPSVFSAIAFRRLKRALLLRFYTESLLAEPDRALLDRIIYASYCDCRSVGLGSAAKRMLDEARAGSGLFRKPSGGAGGGAAWST